MPDETSTIAFRGRYLDVIWEAGREYTHNRRSRGVVLVIPLTAGGDIIFIEQYRWPLKRTVIEYPAGLVGDEGDADETFEAAARRELLEETGYEAGDLQFLLRGPSSPGSSTEVVSFYLAHDARKVREVGDCGHGRIEIHRIRLSGAAAWLNAKSAGGVLVDPRVYLGLHLAAAHHDASRSDRP